MKKKGGGEVSPHPSFLSGIQPLCLEILGEYVGRIYDQVKGRPMYIVDRKVNL